MNRTKLKKALNTVSLMLIGTDIALFIKGIVDNSRKEKESTTKKTETITLAPDKASIRDKITELFGNNPITTPERTIEILVEDDVEKLARLRIEWRENPDAETFALVVSHIDETGIVPVTVHETILHGQSDEAKTAVTQDFEKVWNKESIHG